MLSSTLKKRCLSFDILTEPLDVSYEAGPVPSLLIRGIYHNVVMGRRPSAFIGV
jgi:hypothetical protein